MSKEMILGRLLGRREAFSIVAARCSAADAAGLRQIRDEKLYLEVTPDWATFCVEFLHMSRENADRLIRLLEEFGNTYFDMAQFTRISAATYRLIASSIQDQALHCNGDVIALIPENAEKVAAAVAELRKAAKPPTTTREAASPEDPIARLERRCSEIVKELEEAACWREHSRQIQAVVCYLRQRVERIERTI